MYIGKNVSAHWKQAYKRDNNITGVVVVSTVVISVRPKGSKLNHKVCSVDSYLKA